MSTTNRPLVAGLALLIGILIGNREGDQATLKDCATKGRAAMAGGGAIECRVASAALFPNP